ncbi:MAG: hypothetical protein RL141_208 [Candidatus Parcubacteria bacterium]|jgi:hypothetical protein
MKIMKDEKQAPDEAILNEEIDIEKYALEGKTPPHARSYRFKVNEVICTWDKPIILGREVLERAGLTPPDQYTLREKIKGGTPRRIELDEKVDLRKPGVEKFRAIRKGQTEGHEYE